MRKRLKAPAEKMALDRILDALKQELIEASDEEIYQAAVELGMNLNMQESAAFAGLTYPSRPQLSDFFELEAFRYLQPPDGASNEVTRPRHARTTRQSARTKSRRRPRRLKGY
jgi:hypothetical protein